MDSFGCRNNAVAASLREGSEGALLAVGKRYPSAIWGVTMSGFAFSFHHGGISVPDLDASIGWYRDMLGFELEKREFVPTIPADIAFIRNGDLRFELFQLADAAPLPADRREPDRDLRTHGNKHVAFVVADPIAFAELLAERGVDVVWARRMPHGAAAFIRDNAGNLIEFLEGSIPTGEPGHL